MARQGHPWFRKSDGWWYVKIGGRLHKLARGRENKDAALTRWHELMTERGSNPPLDSPDHTIASIIDLYLAHIERSRAPRTFANCKYYLQRFAEAHGFRLVRDCRPIHLTHWIDANRQWVSDWTVSNVIGTVQRPFNWASRQGLIPSNPFRVVRHRTGQPRRPLADEEFRSLLRATGPSRRWPRDFVRTRTPKRPSRAARFRHVLLFMRNTGARPSEMAALTWNDVDLENGVAILREHKTARTQRTPRPRVIQLVPVVVRLLRYLASRCPLSTDRVFLTARGTPWNRWNLCLRMRRLREKANVPADAKLYGIRHQFGTQSIVNGVDLKTLAELMGHTTTRMTEHYIHLAGRQSHLAAAMRQAVCGRQGA